MRCLPPRSRVPVYHDNEKEVNKERKHGDQQHFIVEFHTIRPPSGYPEVRQMLERSPLTNWFETSLPRFDLVFSDWKALKGSVSERVLSERRNHVLRMTASARGGNFKGLSPSSPPSERTSLVKVVRLMI